MRLILGSVVVAAAMAYAAPGLAQQCAPNYLQSGTLFAACRGIVHQPHNKGGFSFTTTSARRMDGAGNVDVYESCVKNTSGKLLSIDWPAAGMRDIPIPNGCAYRQPRNSNYPKPGANRPDFMVTCIRFGNRWQHKDDANYLPTPQQVKSGFREPNCDGQVVSSDEPPPPEEGGKHFEFLRQLKEFVGKSLTIFDTDASEDSAKLGAFIVDTRFTLTSETTYTYKIDFYLKEIDPDAFEHFSGFVVSPPALLSGPFLDKGWSDEQATIRPKEHKSFELTLPYQAELDLGEETMALKSLAEGVGNRSLLVPVLE
ncbi:MULTISPECIES: hypothetical protein [unclassified Ensifer]|uniref:hypothetical protein n=1 Tax=unclassified Ensifer TaxID=2633371 RepID=UPI0008130652|nr:MULTISPECIES: hypothetical protein [unclassified Ensifer]OCO98893.1 hypothetical protein BC362_27005 [Ensifer sp. LC14]OCP04426.1 hypothetical protein BBX50_25630 [Ensifer sp. LC11]OCP04707.1 hypothetical protein BC374_25650 [Ensifer sp. LC13]OCP30531.1 hypothetical protein BC364_25665 [Ensifer sp. LC499]